MTPDAQSNLSAVKAFFQALEDHEKEALASLLATSVIEEIPLTNPAWPESPSRFDGKNAVMGYLGQIIDGFSRTVLSDKVFYVADDGSAVFMEAKGDLIQAGTGKPYNNVYIFKFVFERGKIVRIGEYANPITYAQLMHLPLP